MPISWEELEGKVTEGFYMWLGKDFFFVSERKVRGEALANDILDTLRIPRSEGARRVVLSRTQKASLEISEAPKGTKWYDISNKWFTCSHKVDEGKTIVLKLFK